MNPVLIGLITVVVGVAVFFAYHFLRSIKNTDVQKAAELRMSITRYRKYQKLYDEYFEIMIKYGASSTTAEKYFRDNVFPNIDNSNEWRRYQAYRETEQRERFMKEICGKR